jgi:tetratricopeptide (TPR) repeat protein
MAVRSIADGGQATGLEVGQVTGDLTVESTVNQIEARIVQGDYVDHRTIANNILVLGDSQALDAILEHLTAILGVDKRAIQELQARAAPEHVRQQIAEVAVAQQEVAARGLPASAGALYRLGLLAAYRRDDTAALDYFRQATQADPDFADAFEAIAWLQQSRAQDDLTRSDYDAAIAKLADARAAVLHTDPLDAQALALRGFIDKTLAQLSEARKRPAETIEYYQEAARFFEHAARLDPHNASAQNGLGNVQYALGNLDAAIAAYRRAIKLVPEYTAAHHDLALAYEGKMRADHARAGKWCRKALEAWRTTYRFAPNDPTFSASYVVTIGQRISWLEQQCT